jgi:hypothetical protein
LVSSISSHPSHDGDHETFKTAIKQHTIILNLNVYLILLEDVNSFGTVVSYIVVVVNIRGLTETAMFADILIRGFDTCK